MYVGKRRRTVALAVLLAAMLGLAACGRACPDGAAGSRRGLGGGRKPGGG